MVDLTDEAKAAIADAVRIVREDKMEAFLRDRLTKHTTPPANDPPKPQDPPANDPPKPQDGPTPPPPKPQDPPPVPPTDAPKRSLWWGEESA